MKGNETIFKNCKVHGRSLHLIVQLGKDCDTVILCVRCFADKRRIFRLAEQKDRERRKEF